MPDRVIRDEITSSDRWVSLPRNTHRLAFVVMLLNADDLGNVEATPGSLWRKWRDPLALTDRQSVAEILNALADAGLVALYEVDGKRYAHIPKFRQRLRYLNGKHPRPPEQMECKEIKALIEKSQTEARLKADRSQTVDARSEVKGGNSNPRAREALPVDKSAKPLHLTPTPQPDGDKSPNVKDGPPRPARGAQDHAGIEALARWFGKWPLVGRPGEDWGAALELVNRMREDHFRTTT